MYISIENIYGKSEMRTRQKQRIVTPGDPWGVEQHNLNTGIEENNHLNPRMTKQ